MGCCASTQAFSIDVYPSRKPFDIEKMCGRWYVVESNLPLWRPEGGKRNPSIVYTLLQNIPTSTDQISEPSANRLHDVVEYNDTLDTSNVKRIVGVDTQLLNLDPTCFRWRGNGCLCCITSDWQIVGYDDDCSVWAFSSFAATPFTPAGFDLYSRKPVMDSEVRNQLQSIIDSDPILRQRAAGLFRTIHDS